MENITEKEEWRKFAPPIRPEEANINPPHLQRLKFNPNYYHPNVDDLKIGDDIVIGQYASDAFGSPSIRWTETKIKGFPLHEVYPSLVDFMKHK